MYYANDTAADANSWLWHGGWCLRRGRNFAVSATQDVEFHIFQAQKLHFQDHNVDFHVLKAQKLNFPNPIPEKSAEAVDIVHAWWYSLSIGPLRLYVELENVYLFL